MKLNYLEALLLWKTIAYTGKKIPSERGEVDEPKSLFGEESSQRGHFNKLFSPLEKKVIEEQQVFVDEYNQKREAAIIAEKSLYPKKDEELEENYDFRINLVVGKQEEIKTSFKELNETIKEVNEREEDFDLTDKTLKVLKKYFNQYGETQGFKPNEDEQVISLIEKLEEVELETKV